MLKRLAPLLLAALLLASPRAARAGDDVQATMLDAAVAAHSQGDWKHLEQVAEGVGPRIWLMVEALCVRGRGGVAVALAKHAKDPDEAGLLRYARRRSASPHPGEKREGLRAAASALDDGRPERALELLAGTRPAHDSVDAAMATLFRARALELTGRLAEAFASYVEAAGAARNLGWRQQAAEVLAQAATCAVGDGDLDAARACLDRAHLLRSSRSEDVVAASLLVDLGTICGWQSDHASARAYYRRAVEALQTLEDVRVEETLRRALSNLGVLEMRLGRYAEALRLQDQALVVVRRGADPSGEAAVLRRLGTLRCALGQYVQGRDLYSDALGLVERVRVTKPSRSNLLDLAETLGSLGNAHFWLEEYDACIRRLDAARTIFRDQLDNAYGAALCAGNMAEAYARKEEYRLAVDLHEVCLEALDELGEGLSAAEGRGMLAETLRRMGRPRKALVEYERALKEARRLAAQDLQVRLHGGLARLHLQEERHGAALGSARAAVDLLQGPLGGLAYGEGCDARAVRAEVFETGLRAALAAGEEGEAAFFLEAGRAGALLDALGGREAVRQATVSDDLARALAAARQDLDESLARLHAAFRSGVLAEIRPARRRLDRARRAYENLSNRQQREAKAGARAVRPGVDALARIRGRLVAGEAYVGYSLGESAAAALVVTTQSAGVISLQDPATVRAAARRVAEAKGAAAEKDVQRLRDLVVTPLKLGAGIRRVYVSPDGVLSIVPFALLLENGRHVTMVPSATMHGLLREEEAQRGEKNGEQVLALGDPAYETLTADGPAPYFAFSSQRLLRLEWSGKAAQEIGDVVLLRERASEAGLRRALSDPAKRWRAVHIGAHGIANTEQPAFSCIALAAGEGEDGFLSAIEVFGMRVSTDLVVLSACDSGIGRVVRGEGLVGLTSAFLLAGAPRVLVSLWPVDDQATGELMRHFYAVWNPEEPKKGLGAAAALAEAQRHMREETRWKEPRYWAAWVLWGLAD